MRYGIMSMAFVLLFLSTVFLSNAFGEFAFIDLEPTANSKIVDTSWWTGDAGAFDFDELYEIAKDGSDFEMENGDTVPFKVADAILIVFGTNSAGNPKRIDGIKVGMAGESIYFVHMTGWENVGAPSYKFVINYEGGSSEELEIESHINSDDWCHIPATLPDENSTQIWVEGGATCGQVSVIATKWENPSPGKKIETIDFVSLETAAVPGLFAITIGGASLAVSPGDKLAYTWAGLKTESQL